MKVRRYVNLSTKKTAHFFDRIWLVWRVGVVQTDLFVHTLSCYRVWNGTHKKKDSAARLYKGAPNLTWHQLRALDSSKFLGPHWHTMLHGHETFLHIIFWTRISRMRWLLTPRLISHHSKRFYRIVGSCTSHVDRILAGFWANCRCYIISLPYHYNNALQNYNKTS